MKSNFFIVEIDSPEEKSLICGQVLNTLPSWFGMQEAIVQYTRQVKCLPLFACIVDERAIGFAAIEQTDGVAAELVVMGILPEYHRQGIGAELVAACERYCLDHGVQTLTVRTLADTHPSKSYARTRAFYSAMGFCSRMVLTDYWDEDNPCLVMVKALMP